jgi:O-methyltransferase
VKRHDLKEVMALVAPYTMVHDAGVRFTVHKAVEAIEREIPGAMVECGVWKGGCGLAMLLAQRMAFGEVVRPVHFMDSFAGLPPAQTRDGVSALQWQASTVDNCIASRAALELMLEQFSFVSGEFELWEGLFADTLPELTQSLEAIALLRLDGDWYDSTRQCLDALVPLTSNHATVIIDDYFAWDGCARAVHDYLSNNDLPYRIRALPNHSSAYFIKENP